MSRAASRSTWQRLDLSSPSAVGALASELATSSFADQLTLDHDPRWWAAQEGNHSRQLAAYVCRENDRLVGFAGCAGHPGSLDVTVGSLSLWSSAAWKLDFVAPPLMNPGPDAESSVHGLSVFISRLRDDLAQDSFAAFGGVAEGSPLAVAIAHSSPCRNGMLRLQRGSFYPHRVARVSRDYEQYLQLLGSRTRADLRRTRRKFLAYRNRSITARCFLSQGDVDEFVRDATTVSTGTWQYRAAGSGLRDVDALTGLYLATAGLGWFRSYVLYADGRPIAFQVGHVYRRTYYAQVIGYDPSWAREHVGIFLHTEVLMDLSSAGCVDWFDFGPGDFSHKQRLATEFQRLGYFYLLPATVRRRALVAAMRVADRASRSAGDILDRAGLRKRSSLLFRVDENR